MQIGLYRTRLEEFEQRLNRELYARCSGLRDQGNLLDVYSDYSDLFSIESVQDVQSELKNTSESFSSRRKSLKKIHEFLIDQRLDYRAAALTQEMERFTAEQTVSWEGKKVSLSQIPSFFKLERDAIKRRKLSDLYGGALRDAGEIVRDRFALLRSTAAALGFGSYLEAREYVTGVNYAPLLNAVDGALARLEDSYLERLRVSVEATLGIALQEAGSWDIAHWRILNDPAQFFAGSRLLPVHAATLSELRLRPENPDAITFDLDITPQKRVRPACIPIRVPQEIKVVMCPEDGSDQYAALLHESGHAHHFAWTSSSLPAEDRLWGDRALSEAYGFLFEHVLLDSHWLAQTLSFVKSREFLRFQSLYRIFLVRRYAGRLRFALKLCREESLDEISDAYAETMRSYTGFRHQTESWMEAVSDGLESADYLRGWILECMLREYLCRRYGSAWMQSRSAGGFLKELWETGFLYRADELGREIGLGSLDPQILMDELLKGLNS
jgi:hypothetical protein